MENDPREQLTVEVCTDCDSKYFHKLYKLYSLSPEKSASKKKEYFDVRVYVCSDCGKVIEPV